MSRFYSHFYWRKRRMKAPKEGQQKSRDQGRCRRRVHGGEDHRGGRRTYSWPRRPLQYSGHFHPACEGGVLSQSSRSQSRTPDSDYFRGRHHQRTCFHHLLPQRCPAPAPLPRKATAFTNEICCLFPRASTTEISDSVRPLHSRHNSGGALRTHDSPMPRTAWIHLHKN